jgi:hypothetical protein
VEIHVKDDDEMDFRLYAAIIEEMDEKRITSPTFQILDLDTVPSSVANLNPSLTINGITELPVFRYKGPDATVSAWTPWTYGESLAIAGSGADVTPSQGSPCLGAATVDGSVKFNAAKYFAASGNTFADVTTEDMVFEAVLKWSTTDGKRQWGKWNSGPGYAFAEHTDRLYCLIQDTSGSVITYTAAMADGAWYHVMCFLDRSGSAQWYVDGVASGSAVAISTRALSLSVAYPLQVGAFGASGQTTSSLAYAALWKRNAWLDTHLQATVAKERFTRLTGFYPQIAKGTTKVPSVLTRASSAHLDKYEADGTTRTLYLVGDNWLRCVHRKDSATTSIKGYLAEPSAQNKALQSQAFATTWAELDAGDTTTNNNAASPNELSTATTLVADATDGDHGVTQDITLTAVAWVFSVFAKAGNKNWLYISDDTVATATCYFNLSTGVLGTKGAGATAAYIEAFGDGWYRCAITFTGTVAAHTFKIQTADGDTDKTVTGDEATTNTYLWGAQCEIGNYPTSYVATTTAAVTRAADTLRYVGDDGNITNNQRGKCECQVLEPNIDSATINAVIDISDGGSAADRVAMLIHSSEYAQLASAGTGGNAGGVNGTTDINDGVIHDLKFLWATNNLRLYVDDTAEGTADTDCMMPNDLDRIDIGQGYTAGNQNKGIISNLKIYDKDKV